MDVVWYPWNGMSWVAPGLSIATLHDASLFSLPPSDPQVREREQRPFRLAAKLARRILTNSEFSKGELVRYLELDPRNVDVVHLGVDKRFFIAHQEHDRGGRESSRLYLLFVGEPEERKGLGTVFSAMTLLPETLRSQTELVIAGATGEYPLRPVPPSIRVDNRGWVDDVTLATLYAGASALVYASKYEGFGLPIVEAMAAGTPVIAGDAPGPREAGGDAALYVPPENPAALAAAIVRVLGEPDLRGRLRAQGRRRALELDWDTTALRTLEVVEETAARALA
jgi:alpha-1,3-rhamnosyl/mannosyltransferase